MTFFELLELFEDFFEFLEDFFEFLEEEEDEESDLPEALGLEDCVVPLTPEVVTVLVLLVKCALFESDVVLVLVPVVELVVPVVDVVVPVVDVVVPVVEVTLDVVGVDFELVADVGELETTW